MPTLRRRAQRLTLHVAAVRIACLLVLCNAAAAAQWTCYGTKPGHPTKEERAAFVREVSELAVKAEKTYGVPAAVLAAMAIAESGYGYTRVALNANNLFAWKFLSRSAADGRKSYIAQCQRRRGVNDRYIVFASRADAFDYVAGKLANVEVYRDHTEKYRAARKRGDPVEPAVKAWLSGIASKYSRKPEEFTKKVLRVMNHAADPSDTLAPDHNLYRLSADVRKK